MPTTARPITARFSAARRLLDDPIALLLMRRDGVSHGDVLALLDRVGRNRAAAAVTERAADAAVLHAA